MLPDTSSITMRRMGWGVLSNSVMGCGFPSSRTSKSVCCEGRDEPAVAIGHGDKHANRVAATAKHRLLRRGHEGEAADGEGAACQESITHTSSHTTHDTVAPPAVVSSTHAS